MIDTHCHLYSEEFTGDIDTVIKRAVDTGIKRFYMPAIDSTTTDVMLQLEIQYPGKCIAMMGLHPCSVNASVSEELKGVTNWLQQRNFAAIGEIGLDFYWDKTYTEQQYYAFRYQIGLALQYDLPIVIHSRNATSETINVIKEYQGRNLQGIFHCFGGTLQEANEIIATGLYLGIGGVVTYKNAGLAEVMRDIALEHIVLETDCPYLAPVPFRGKRNESSYLEIIAQKIADCKGVSIGTVKEVTTENALRIFK